MKFFKIVLLNIASASFLLAWSCPVEIDYETNSQSKANEYIQKMGNELNGKIKNSTNSLITPPINQIKYKAKKC